MVRLGNSSGRTRNSRTLDPNLSGWAGIEDHLITNDDASMSDYADDIDTMLVFAALFSAVVTTFAVQTYQSLQPDSSDITNQLIAYQISLQVTQTNMPPVISSAVSDLLSPQPSSTTTSARWINALFFLSLVLSLAAALIGIMAKQWIREFLKWHSALAQPRDNVLVRQIRFEAWEEWKVEGVLWSIPILLELAMILFLAGITALLWTLDDALAKAITAVVAIFIGIVAMFTALPVFDKRCPYKSPTAWVLLRIYTLTRTFTIASFLRVTRVCDLKTPLNHPVLISLVERARNAITSLTALQNDLGQLKSWRDWDFDSSRPSNWVGRTWPWYSHSATDHVLAELAEEAAGLPLIPRHNPPRDWSGDRTLRRVMEDVRETFVLVRALSWVREASQDKQVDWYMEEAIRSFHTALRAEMDDPVRVRTTTIWCIIGALCNHTLRRPKLHLAAPHHGSKSAATHTPHSIVQLRSSIGVHTAFVQGGDPDFRLYLNSTWDTDTNDLTTLWRRVVPSHQTAILLRLTAVDIHHATSLESDHSGNTGVKSQVISRGDEWIRDVGRLRRVAELISLIVCLIHDAGDGLEIAQVLGSETYLAGLRSVVCVAGKQKYLLDTSAPRLRSQAFWVAQLIGRITLDEKNTIGTVSFLVRLGSTLATPADKCLVLLPGTTTRIDHEAFLLRYFVDSPSTWKHDEFNMFARCVDSWLYCLASESGNARSTPSGESVDQLQAISMHRILLKIHGAINLLLTRGDLWYGNDSRPGFSVDVTGDWLFWLFNGADAIILRYSWNTITATIFRDLLHALVQAYRVLGFMNAFAWPHFLHDNLKKTHHAPCDKPACPWYSHTCDSVETCPLLKRCRRTHTPLVIPSRSRDRDSPIKETTSGHKHALLARCGRWLTRRGSPSASGTEGAPVPADAIGRAEQGVSPLESDSHAESQPVPRAGATKPDGRRVTLPQLLNLLRWMHGPLTPLGTVPEEFMTPWILAQSEDLASVIPGSPQREPEETSTAVVEHVLESPSGGVIDDADALTLLWRELPFASDSAVDDIPAGILSSDPVLSVHEDTAIAQMSRAGEHEELATPDVEVVDGSPLDPLVGLELVAQGDPQTLRAPDPITPLPQYQELFPED